MFLLYLCIAMLSIVCQILVEITSMLGDGMLGPYLVLFFICQNAC